MRGAEKFIKDLANEAGNAVLARFKKDGELYRKSEHRLDVVTKADLMSERLIISRIRERFPKHGIIAEESGRSADDAEYVWVIDPIDGTLNFSLGIPLFGVMIALARRRTVILAAIKLPTVNELFFAKAGGGAYLNGSRIRCGRATTLEHSTGSTSSGLRASTVTFFRKLLDVASDKNMTVTSYGGICVNACFVACGRRDWTVQPSAAIHDFAAPALILKEAGCTVSDLCGAPWKLGVNEMVAANPRLHKKLIEITRR